MLIKTPNLIFLFTLGMGTMIACSSSSWVMAWIGLEINLMSFIPLLINKLNPTTMETTIKYFLTQAMASMIIIFISISSNLSSNFDLIMEMNLLLTSSLALKAGVAPFHFWFPQVMEYASWPQALLILTWQKVAPLILISFCFNLLIPFIIISSAIVGMMGGLNQTSLKKILTFSSLIHASWLISISFISDLIWWTYFLSYTLMTISIVLSISFFNFSSINHINSINLTPILKTILMINFMSLAGLPPFIGFTIKMMAMNSMVETNFNIMILLTLILASLISFYFYSRLMYSSWLIFDGKSKPIWFAPKTNSLITSTVFASLMGNILISFLVIMS